MLPPSPLRCELPRTLLLKLFGKSERAPLWDPTSQQNGARSALIAALRYQKHTIQTPPAIFQTVSEGVFSEVVPSSQLSLQWAQALPGGSVGEEERHHEGNRPGHLRLTRCPGTQRHRQARDRRRRRGTGSRACGWRRSGVWHVMTGLPYPIRLAGYGLRAPCKACATTGRCARGRKCWSSVRREEWGPLPCRSPRRWARTSAACAAPRRWTWSDPSAPTTSSTTPKRTSPRTGSATT